MSPGTTLNQTETSPASAAAPIDLFRNTPDGRELDLSRVALLLFRAKKVILLAAVAAAVVMAVIVFFVLKPTYTAEAVFLPPQTSPGSGLAQLASQLGPMNALSALGGLKSPGDIYIGILKSRTIADDLIKQFDLQSVYKAKKLSDAEKDLGKHSNFDLGKDTLVTISVKDHDPKRAADMANAYLKELTAQNGRLALTGASQRTLFFQQQLQKEETALSDAEVALKKMEEQTGFIAPVDQSRATIDDIEQTRAQITAREITLSSLTQSNTEQNPEVIRLKAEIATLRKKLNQLQDGKGQHQPGDIQHPTAKVPALELEYVRKARDVKYRGATATVLLSTHEGFGLPVVEAMASGTPVLAANATSLPEISGGAAVLVHPLQEEEIADGMCRIATDEALREKCRKMGLEQSRRFNWDNSADQLTSILAEAARTSFRKTPLAGTGVLS